MEEWKERSDKMNIAEQSMGPLFTSPDPDEARAYFRGKSRAKANKLMSLKEAVERFIHDGDYLAIGGFGTTRTPIAACHEILRRGLKNMGFAGHTSTHDFQILAAGEVFDRVDIAYVIGLEARGISPCARTYMESGRVRVCEWSNFSLAARLKAAAMGIPFLPTRNMLGTDTYRYSAAKVMTCPFTEKKMMLQPALYPDVAVIHVHEADVNGNCRIRGSVIADDDLARASKKLIITAERIIPNSEIRSDPDRTAIPYYLVDAVCEVPFGAYPSAMPYEYYSDEAHLKEWLTVQNNSNNFADFLRRNIYDCPDHGTYIEINGGINRIQELRAKELLLHKEDINAEL
jgi:glutaconate CoA-transferase subunit A